jgi:hypothetical protein
VTAKRKANEKVSPALRRKIIARDMVKYAGAKVSDLPPAGPRKHMGLYEMTLRGGPPEGLTAHVDTLRINDIPAAEFKPMVERPSPTKFRVTAVVVERTKAVGDISTTSKATVNIAGERELSESEVVSLANLAHSGIAEFIAEK